MPRRTRPSPLRARRARRGAALLAAALAAGGLGAPGPAAAAGGAPAPTAACPVHQPAGTPYAVGVNCRLVEVDGHPRQFIVYVPRRPRPSAPAPLVFMFHGGSGNGEQFLRISGWREQADATGLIAVFPTALRSRTLDNGRTETHWNTFDARARRSTSMSARRATPPARRGRRTTSASPTRWWPTSPRACRSTATACTRPASPTAARSPAASRWSGRRCSRRPRSPGAGSHERAGAGSVPSRCTWRSGRSTTACWPTRARPRSPSSRSVPSTCWRVPVVAATLGAHLDTLGLDENDFGGDRIAAADLPALAARRARAPAGRCCRFAAIGGLPHHYPRGDDNLAGFAAAPEFWAFFVDHPLP